ncbi:hypothetical protein [Aeromonas dhakensis]|nr:hypothetical protein [Aeromonas dhakensis]
MAREQAQPDTAARGALEAMMLMGKIGIAAIEPTRRSAGGSAVVM